MLGYDGRSTVLIIVLVLFTVEAALEEPGYWDTTQEELSELVRQSQKEGMLPADRFQSGVSCDTLPGYDPEKAYRATNATVLLLDEAILCADFLATCSMSRESKEKWVLDKAAWFSAPHIDAGVNKIPHDSSQELKARRLCAGNRALLLPANEEYGARWIDVKGLGAREPKNHSKAKKIDHSNGLVELENALWEFINEKTLAAALAHHARKHPNDESQSFTTVGVYAVLSLGFEFTWETETEGDLRYYSAGAIVRQASRRHPNPFGLIPPDEATVLEQIMNAYGMRSDTASQDYRWENFPNSKCRRINLQGTMLPRTVTDFGNLYPDKDWPPSPSDCLVHWGNIYKLRSTPLWKESSLGSAKVREFLKEELRDLPLVKNATWPAKPSNGVRQRRMWETADGWWNGRLSSADVRKAIDVGLIDGILAEEDIADIEKDDGEL